MAYSSFFVLWTQDNKPLDDSPRFSERVYQFRQFFRLSTLEIILNTYQGTLLRHFMVNLQKLIQGAYLLTKGSPEQVATIIQFYQMFPTYVLITLSICFINYKARQVRTRQFYDIEPFLNTIYQDMDAEIFEQLKTDYNDAERHDKNKFSSIETDKQPGQLTDIPKSYYNLTQNMVLCPLEMTMYFMILGPVILATMAGLALVVGYLQYYLGNQSKACRDEAVAAQKEVNEATHPNFLARAITNINKNLAQKYNEIDIDMTRNFSIAIFSLALMLTCANFVFIGYYDLAMLMAQTATATQAFARINKYLGLAKNHITFKAYMEAKCEAYNRKRPENPVQNILNTLPQYRWSTYKRLGLYSRLILAVAGLCILPTAIFTPILPSLAWLTGQQILGGGLLLWTITAIMLKNTEAQNITSHYAAMAISTTLTIIAAITAYQFMFAPHVLYCITGWWPAKQTMQTLSKIFIDTPLKTLGIFIATCVGFYGIDQYFSQLAFTCDQILTWLSQEAIMLLKLPLYPINAAATALRYGGQGIKNSYGWAHRQYDQCFDAFSASLDY